MLIHIIIIEASAQPVCVFLWLCTQWGRQKHREGVFSGSQTPYFHLLAWHYNRRQTAVKRVFGCVSHHRQESLLRALPHSSRPPCSPHRCPLFIYLNGKHIKAWESGRKHNACLVPALKNTQLMKPLIQYGRWSSAVKLLSTDLLVI